MRAPIAVPEFVFRLSKKEKAAFDAVKSCVGVDVPVAKADPVESRTAEIQSDCLNLCQIRVTEIRVPECGASQVAVRKVRAAEVRAIKIDARQVTVGEPGARSVAGDEDVLKSRIAPPSVCEPGLPDIRTVCPCGTGQIAAEARSP